MSDTRVAEYSLASETCSVGDSLRRDVPGSRAQLEALEPFSEEKPLASRAGCLSGETAMLTACVINASRCHVPTYRVAWRKLAILEAAETLADLRIPPGNRLEKLRGNRAGQHSIRINQQWRICFVWSDAGPEDVEIVDYH